MPGRRPWGRRTRGALVRTVGRELTGPCSLAADILEFFAGFETNRASGRDFHFLARPRITADAALPRFHLEHAEAAQLDALALHHRGPHGVEHRVHRDFRLHLRDFGEPRDLVDDVHLYHDRLRLNLAAQRCL